ncbi:ubiquitin-like domain-containing protein [Citrus sinensis]|uniref:Ubiquitin-like domain-containing protein n=1 Tax=Citrus sinensis TaxID=2711 RepID=A0ACB8NM84_CITSI|nr:ubiquitin-like domain-containing protein [Citrus sinensis]
MYASCGFQFLHPILALTEQIVAITGVILQQQRLLHQGKVLKNDHILSAYCILSIAEFAATYPASSFSNPQMDLNRIFSTLNSSQIATTGRNNEEVDLRSNSSNVATSQIQSILESLQPPFLNHLRLEFDINRTGAQHRSLQELDVDPHAARRQRGLPRPASLAEVMMSTRQLLMDKVAALLFNLPRQLMDQAQVTDSSPQMDIQMNARRSGFLLQNGLDSEDDPPSPPGAKRPKAI